VQLLLHRHPAAERAREGLKRVVLKN
jgi:hypothetical protein